MSFPAENKNISFIVNPRAGVGQGGALEKLIAVQAQAHQSMVEVKYTRERGHATELAALAARQGADVVVAVGGDGTLNEVAQGLIGTPACMGIVPRGSGNGLARHLGIPLNTAQAVNALFSSQEFAMDVFRVNGKLSLNVSGIGFDGHVTNLFGVKTGRGLLGYVTVTVQEFTTFREFHAEVIIDHRHINRSAFIIAIANSSQYGNNAFIAPSASVCDGLLHVNFLKKIPLYRMDFLYDFFAGKVGQSPYSDIIETTAMEVTTSFPVAHHVDGEPAGLETHFRVALTPGALKVLYPGHRKKSV